MQYVVLQRKKEGSNMQSNRTRWPSASGQCVHTTASKLDTNFNVQVYTDRYMQTSTKFEAQV